MQLTWTNDLALGDEAIDDDHRYAVEMMARIATAADAEVTALFADFVTHMYEHFAREEALMRACDFPALHCHAGEHTRVLGLLDGLAVQVAAGNPELARGFAAEAGPAWFLDHRNTMDLVTVGFAHAHAHARH